MAAVANLSTLKPYLPPFDPRAPGAVSRWTRFWADSAALSALPEKGRHLLEGERERLLALSQHEQEAHRERPGRIAGVDEAGRGALAGPVVAAAVVFRGNPMIPGLSDSKLLSPQEREDILPWIERAAVGIAVSLGDVELINSINILQASLSAMKEALESLPVKPAMVLVDGNQSIPGWKGAQKTLVKGDCCSYSVAAASVVAKTFRDRLMMVWDRFFPAYDLAHNKGYTTDSHLAALKRYGATPIHRRYFEPVREFALPTRQLRFWDT